MGLLATVQDREPALNDEGRSDFHALRERAGCKRVLLRAIRALLAGGGLRIECWTLAAP